jgi:hypothetical protein
LPVYSCQIEGTGETRIVRAKSAAQARAHLVKAETLSAEELADALSKDGAKLETATVAVEEPEPKSEHKPAGDADDKGGK